MIQVQDIDGNVYNTVWIGKQLWLAENLKVTKFRNGDPITRLYNGNYYVSEGYPRYIPSIETGYDGYGNYYNLEALYDTRNIAPNGCRVPGYYDFVELYEYLISVHNDQVQAASALASPRQAPTYPHPRWDDNITTILNDTYGFKALPAGSFQVDGLVYNIDYTQLYGNAILTMDGTLGDFAAWYYHHPNPQSIWRNNKAQIIMSLNVLSFFGPFQDFGHVGLPLAGKYFMSVRCLVNTNKINMLL